MLLVTGILPADAGDSSPDVDARLAGRLQAARDSALVATGTIGVSVAVIMPDGALWTGVSGLSHPGVPITADMLFDMGSTGKNIMAALVLDLVDDSLISLDDPIKDHLRPFPNVDGGITIRQLLNHTSGLYMWVELPG
jgi:D-alanyl-D-alanine carboxypeptidase